MAVTPDKDDAVRRRVACCVCASARPPHAPCHACMLWIVIAELAASLLMRGRQPRRAGPS